MQAGRSVVLDQLQKTHWIMFPESPVAPWLQAEKGLTCQGRGGLLAVAEDGWDTTEGGGKEKLLAELSYRGMFQD